MTFDSLRLYISSTGNNLPPEPAKIKDKGERGLSISLMQFFLTTHLLHRQEHGSEPARPLSGYCDRLTDKLTNQHTDQSNDRQTGRPGYRDVLLPMICWFFAVVRSPNSFNDKNENMEKSIFYFLHSHVYIVCKCPW